MEKIGYWALGLSRSCFSCPVVSAWIQMVTPDTSGIIYRILVHPMGQAITYLVENFNWSYGWAVILMTVIVRIIILPLGISQSKKQ